MINLIKEDKHIANMLLQKGQSVFTYNMAEKKLDKLGYRQGSLVMKKGFMYVCAINKRNAAKKFIKLLTKYK